MGREGGYGALHERDAMELADMISTFNTKTQAGRRRVAMTLYCFSKLYENHGRPYFNVGRGQIAKACDVPTSCAQRFLEDMEELGWMVRVGETRSGKLVKRSFCWLVENPEKRSGYDRKNGQGVTETPPIFGQVPDRNHLQKRSPSRTRYRGADNTPPDTDVSAGVTAEGDLIWTMDDFDRIRSQKGPDFGQSSSGGMEPPQGIV